MLGDQDTPVRIDFEDGKAEIRDLDRSMLDVVVARLRLRPDEILFLIGHADSAERPGRAVELSRERVDAVRRYLMQHGINEDRLIPDARGALEPVTLDDPEEARRANRRVDFVFQRATATPP
jgi:outer membrane protein OmpA-like peptidoglycan-associated protein